MGKERIKQNQERTSEMLDRIHSAHQKTLADLPPSGEFPCLREITPGNFIGAKGGGEVKYDDEYYACVCCDYANICKEHG